MLKYVFGFFKTKKEKRKRVQMATKLEGVGGWSKALVAGPIKKL